MLWIPVDNATINNKAEEETERGRIRHETFSTCVTGTGATLDYEEIWDECGLR